MGDNSSNQAPSESGRRKCLCAWSLKCEKKHSHSRKLIHIDSNWSNQGKCRLQEWDDWRVGSDFSVYAMKKTFLIAFKPPECQAKKQGKPRNMGKTNIIFSLSNMTSCEFLSDLLNWVSCEGVVGLADNQIVKKRPEINTGKLWS